MSPEVQVVLSSALTFGVPLIFAVRELRAMRRRPRGFGNGPDRPDRPTPPPVPGRDQPGQRPLPACLIPVRTNLVQRPERVLERV